MRDRIKPFGHGCATAWEKTTIIFAVLIYLTTIITAIGFLLGYKPRNGLSMPKFDGQEEESKQTSIKDPTRGTPDGGELSEEGDITETQTPTSKNDRQPKLEDPASTEPIFKKETETYSATVTFSRSQCLAGKPLELEEAIRKAKKNVSSSLERNQETKFRTRNLQ